MVTGASTADLALVLIDARKGLLEQSRRHAYLAALLGIRHLVACVNKMDLVGFDEARFREIEAAFGELGAQLGIADVARGADLRAATATTSSTARTRLAWYAAPPLLEHLETVEVDARPQPRRRALPGPVDGPRRRLPRLRGPASPAGCWRPATRSSCCRGRALDGRRDRHAAAGRSSARCRRWWPRVRLEPTSSTSAAATSRRAGAESPRSRASSTRRCAGWSRRPPASARATCSSTPRARVRATIAEISRGWTWPRFEASPADELGLNDIGRITLRTAAPVLADPYAYNRATGAFILIDERTHDTVAAGMVEVARGRPRRRARAPPDIRWHPSALARSVRWALTGQRGATLWLTGLPASGKSTIAVAVERAAGGRGPLRLPARRRQPPPRALGRPRLRPRVALGEHPPRGPRRAAVRRRRRGRRRLARLALPRGPARRAAPARGGGAGRSSRSSSTRRSRSARGATRRASTRAPAPGG